MNTIDNIIINHILASQYHSDMAKKCQYIGDYGGKNYHYNQKDAHINASYKILNSIKKTRIRWSFERVLDQKGNPSNLFTFEFNFKGKHYQFSFHNFNNYGAKNKGNNLPWDGIIGGCQKSYKKILALKNK